MEPQNQGFVNLGSLETMMPQEEKLEVGKAKKKLVIGIPKESSFQERRIALIPEAVNTLTENGHKIVVQKDAGAQSHFSDMDFADSGATIVETDDEVFKSDIILKVAPVSEKELDILKIRQTILSAVHLTAHNKEYFQKLILKKITAVAFEYIRDRTNAAPVIRSISEIVGTASIHIACEYLSHPDYGTGRMLGGFTGISPSEVVILGAGTVGEFAARTAIGMGAYVKVFDNSVHKLRQLQYHLHQNLFTSTIQSAELAKALKTADVLICAIHSKKHHTPVIVTEAMVRKMKEGSVIIDVSIDQGGLVETSRITNHNEPVFQKYGVTHYCVPNIASRVPQTASIALSNFFAPLLLRAGELGGIDKLLVTDYYFRQGVYLYNGILTSRVIGEYYDLPFQDIDLLMAAFH